MSPDLAGALAEFLEASRLDPAFATAHLNAAKVLLEKGERLRANEQFRLAMNGDDAEIRSQAAAPLNK